MSVAMKHTRQGHVDALIERAPQMRGSAVLDADVAKATKTCDFEKTFPGLRVGVRDVFGESGTAASLFDKYGLRAANIVTAAHALLARRTA
jgi:transketolase C-terminal domain/subunit